jgi:nicotinate dehydrogenase subunit B
MPAIALSRRTLLKSGALVVGFSMLPVSCVSYAAVDMPRLKSTADDDVDGFLAIHDDGRVTVYSGKVDLGTGVQTAMAQIVAEELDVAMDQITVIQGDSALTPDQGITSGSQSIQTGGMQIRRAAATARQALLLEAASRLGRSPNELRVANGVITPSAGAEAISYAELVRGAGLQLKIDRNAPLKAPANYQIVGQSTERRDIPAKVRATFTYIHDFRVPGMLHARVVRPPAMQATLLEIDESSLRNIPGIVKVVREGNFVGVVAETEWSAVRAARQLKTRWTDWSGLPEQDKLWESVRATKVIKEETTSRVGDAQDALANASRTLAATYDFAIHTHGSIGPSCAVARFDDGQLTCWTASQATHRLRGQLAAMLQLPAQQIRTIYLEGAGCYGRNGHEDAAADAALLARAVGKPVRVQWMRDDEHGWDPKGPPTLIDMRAAIDKEGRVSAWCSDVFVPDATPGGVALSAAELANLPHEAGMSPGGVTANSAIPYRFPNVLTKGHRLAWTPFRPSWIRSPGRLQNTFANESFVDELAAAVGADPLAFRLEFMDPADARGIETLRRVAALASWQPRAGGRGSPAGRIATGRGLAFVRYDMTRTYVATVAEVEVELSSGAIRARRFFVTHDCGQIINPDGVRNQIEGCIVQTLSRTLKEELKFNRSTVTSRDWVSYPILTFPEVPEIVIELIDRPNEAPWGAGEMAAAVVSAAVSNAVFDATGARLRSVPFTPPKVAAALAAEASGRSA